jgi:hypothetical protein
MPGSILNHLRGNAVGYLALFAALGGTSYAAVAIPAGAIHTRELANGAVTRTKLAKASVGENNLVRQSLTAADFKPGALAKAVGSSGAPGANGSSGSPGSAGGTGPAGLNGNASIVLRSRSTGPVTAPHGASTAVPLSAASWTQGSSEMNLITGSVDIGIPSTCTGSFGNSLSVAVDGIPNTFAVAPTAPASSTVTVPFAVSELMEPNNSKQHAVTATLGNSCTKSGEDFTVSNVKVDVVSLH